MCGGRSFCTQVPDPISSSAQDSLLGANRLAIVVLDGLAQNCCLRLHFSRVLFFWQGFFIVVHAHVCPWVFLTFLASVQIVPLLLSIDKILCLWVFSAFVVGPRRFSGPSRPPLGPLQAGSAPRGQFPVESRHHSDSYTSAPNMWHEQSSTYPFVPSDVNWPVKGQFSTRSVCILPFSKTCNRATLEESPSWPERVTRRLPAPAVRLRRSAALSRQAQSASSHLVPLAHRPADSHNFGIHGRHTELHVVHTSDLAAAHVPTDAENTVRCCRNTRGGPTSRAWLARHFPPQGHA